MSHAPSAVRRATVDDLAELKRLWEENSYQVLDLERHLTEFQVVRGPQGELLGAIGLHIEGKLGLLHSEAFANPEDEGGLRPDLWDRIKAVARNHGLLRVWTRDQAPFWHHSGFVEAGPELLQKLPKTFGDPHSRWFTLAVREEAAAVVDLEKELELFQQAARADTETALGQARKLKTLAYTIGCILGAAAILGAILLTERALRARDARPRRNVSPAEQPAFQAQTLPPAAEPEHPGPATNPPPSN